MHFLCLPGQTLAGRPVGLLTPRDTVPLPSWQGDGALRALSVQHGPPWQEQLTPRGAGRLEAEPVPKDNLPCQWWGQWGGRAGLCLSFPWGLSRVGARVFCKSLGLTSFWPFQFEAGLCCDRCQSQTQQYWGDVAEGPIGDTTRVAALMDQIWKQIPFKKKGLILLPLSTGSSVPIQPHGFG